MYADEKPPGPFPSPGQDYDLPGADQGTPTSAAEDALGFFFGRQFETWKGLRIWIEQEWIKDLMAYKQMGEGTTPNMPTSTAPFGNATGKANAPPTTYHGHIFSGAARSKANTAYARLCDPLFSGADKHWSITPTPLPEINGQEIQDLKPLQDEIARRTQAMEKEMEDQLLAMGYEGKAKNCIKQGTVFGTGVVKGIIPMEVKTQAWGQVTTLDGLGNPLTSWELQDKVELKPVMGNGYISIFDVYPDPYASCAEDMSGCFQRHVLNRGDFEALTEDEQFDKAKIREILSNYDNGNHVALWHETERKRIAKVLDTSGSQSGRFDVLEYWGQCSGKILKTHGIDGIDALDETETYFVCVWTCAYKTILARIAPMKRNLNPYRFFHYAKEPDQFWGISPVRMIRGASLPMHNAAIRGLCDDLSMNVLPMREVNVKFLKDGQDPAAIAPGMCFLRDSGDAREPAVRFFSPDSKANAILPILDVSHRMFDEESNMPSYTQGMQIKGANETASGTSMLMGAANVTTKDIVVNFEDGIIKPILQSLYDWNMQFNPREDIKGDMQIEANGQTALTGKEIQSQRLIQFLTQTANPLDAPMVDRRYLLREAAKSLEIDPDKAVPDLEQAMVEQQPNGQIDPYAPNGAVMQGGVAGGARLHPDTQGYDQNGDGNQFVQ